MAIEGLNTQNQTVFNIDEQKKLEKIRAQQSANAQNTPKDNPKSPKIIEMEVETKKKGGFLNTVKTFFNLMTDDIPKYTQKVERVCNTGMRIMDNIQEMTANYKNYASSLSSYNLGIRLVCDRHLPMTDIFGHDMELQMSQSFAHDIEGIYVQSKMHLRYDMSMPYNMPVHQLQPDPTMFPQGYNAREVFSEIHYPTPKPNSPVLISQLGLIIFYSDEERQRYKMKMQAKGSSPLHSERFFIDVLNRRYIDEPGLHGHLINLSNREYTIKMGDRLFKIPKMTKQEYLNTFIERDAEAEIDIDDKEDVDILVYKISSISNKPLDREELDGMNNHKHQSTGDLIIKIPASKRNSDKPIYVKSYDLMLFSSYEIGVTFMRQNHDMHSLEEQIIKGVSEIVGKKIRDEEIKQEKEQKETIRRVVKISLVAGAVITGMLICKSMLKPLLSKIGTLIEITANNIPTEVPVPPVTTFGDTIANTDWTSAAQALADGLAAVA